MDISIVKKFCKIDYDDDDDLIEILMEAAQQYLIEAVGSYKDDDPLMQLLVLNLVNDMHSKRCYTVTDEVKKQYTTSSLLLQLQLKYGDDDDDDDS